MNEVPEARVDLQPFAVGSEVTFIAWCFADGFVCARAALRSLERAPGQVASVCNLIMVATR